MRAPGGGGPAFGAPEERQIVVGSFGIDFMYLAIYCEKRNTIIVLQAKEVFFAFKWLLLLTTCVPIIESSKPNFSVGSQCGYWNFEAYCGT